MLPKTGANETAATVVNLTPPPVSGGDPILTPSWARARDRACAALLAGERVLLVTGPAGTGKTVLLHDIARLLGFVGWRVTMGIDRGEERQPDLIRSAVLIDDADRLSDLELMSLERREAGALLLVGQDVLTSRCPGRLRVSVSALAQNEAIEFTRAWLARMGHAPARIDDDGIARIAALSGGIARVITDLLRLSVWLADGAGVDRISVDHIEAAAELRESLNGEGDLEPANPSSSEEEGDAADLAASTLFEADDATLAQARPHALPLPRTLPLGPAASEAMVLSEPRQTEGGEGGDRSPASATFAPKRPRKLATGVLASVVIGCAGLGAAAYQLHSAGPGPAALETSASVTVPGSVARPPSSTTNTEAAATPAGPAPARATTRRIADRETAAGARAHPLIVVHPAGAADGRSVADTLAGKMGLGRDQLTVGKVGEARSSATIGLFRAEDHKLARRLGDELTAMGIAWRIEKLANSTPDSFERPIEVWLPSQMSVRALSSPHARK